MRGNNRNRLVQRGGGACESEYRTAPAERARVRAGTGAGAGAGAGVDVGGMCGAAAAGSCGSPRSRFVEPAGIGAGAAGGCGFGAADGGRL